MPARTRVSSIVVPRMRTAEAQDTTALEAAVAAIVDVVLKATSLAERYEASPAASSSPSRERITVLRSAAARGRSAVLALVGETR